MKVQSRSLRYTESFFTNLRGSSQDSASAIVPLVIGLTRCRSVVDVGCGDGTWLRVFMERGVTDVLGIDGDYVSSEVLQIPEHCFLAHDLRRLLKLERSFDLAISLEVAEHLPLDCAAIFVDFLTGLAPIVLFSAAIPHQSGIGHVNEQWQDWWAGQFAKRDYAPIDCIRRQVWSNPKVAWYYAQNTVLFVHNDYLRSSPLLRAASSRAGSTCLPVVHPRLYELYVRRLKARSRSFFTVVRHSMRAIRRRINGNSVLL